MYSLYFFSFLAIITLSYYAKTNGVHASSLKDHKEVHSKGKLNKGSLELIMSEVDPGNLLPNFLFLQGEVEGGASKVNLGGGRGQAKPFVPDDNVGNDIFDGAMDDLRSPQLPYLTNDIWGCEREKKVIETYDLENDYLLASITPQWGGRIWRVYDKVRKREWVYNNKAHQPANIATLKAWTSGGIEWNWSPGIIGHSVFTEQNVWMGKMKTNDKYGDVVRVYEFDRYNGTVWSVDILLKDDTLWVHPRIINPTENDLRGYWWTCVAVTGSPDIRVVTPATSVIENSRDPFRKAGWPAFAMGSQNSSFKGYQNDYFTDNSYMGNIISGDYFVRIPKPQQPYIGHVESDGFTVIHAHPLNGTKFFTWGQNGPARFWQDFLGGGAENREGDYCELQIGPAPTQFQSWPLPKNSVVQWTEYFGAFDGNNKKLRSTKYEKALKEVDKNFFNKNNDEIYAFNKEIDEYFKDLEHESPEEILFEGTSWGALHETLLKGKPGTIFKSTPFMFTKEMNLELQPWMDLLNNGTFSEESLKRTPLSYNLEPKWIELLEKSGQQNSMTWLHHLHLGIYKTETGAVEEPIQHFEASLQLKANPIAARCLALLQSNYLDAIPYFSQAWDLAINLDSNVEKDAKTRLIRNLANEIASFYLSYFDVNKQIQEELYHFLVNQVEPQAAASGDKKLLELDNILYAQTRVYVVYLESPNDALNVLSTNCFPTYGKARENLISTWYEAKELQASQKNEKKSLTKIEAHDVRVNNPPTRNLGCPYASWYCETYW